MRGVFMFAVRRFVLWSAFCLLLSTSVLGVFFPHTLREVTASTRDMLGITETVYPYYFIYEEKSGHHLMTVSIVVTTGDELISEDNKLYRIVRVDENKAYARYVRDFVLPGLSP